jgi:hypothetical protein
MTGKPHHSSLIPYEAEIIDLRCRRPPMPYTEIAALLCEKYKLTVQAPAIFKFIRVRSRGRKVYSYGRNVQSEKLAAPSPPVSEQPKSEWNFKYSERYNLTRLPPDVAAARRKKLEEKGH